MALVDQESCLRGFYSVFLRHCDVEPAIATFDGVRSPPDVVRLYPKPRYDYTLASAFLDTAVSGYITSRRDNAPNKNTGHRYVYTKVTFYKTKNVFFGKKRGMGK